ncbi:MAG TPA: hypothetical protein ENI05_09105 [Porticoccus sp.]|nr:hypothetical protein [Porticoccus sp.]
MDLYELPFAKIIILRKDIAEVIVNEGVEMDEGMIDQYHDFLLSHLQAPFSLLVNKVNSYTYDYPAQKNLATLKEINAMAVVTYNRMAEITTGFLAALPRDVEWNIKIFSNRDDALSWLVLEQEKPNKAI